MSWSGDGKMLFLSAGEASGGTVLIPWRGGETAAAGGKLSPADFLKLPGALLVQESSIAPGQTADRFAFTRQAEQSNLYRIPLP